MGQASKYIDLIEGFKLGSLGVSRKPKVTAQQPAQPKSEKPHSELDHIRVILEITSQNRSNMPGLRWEDFDRLIYMIRLVSPTRSPGVDDWYVEIACGLPQTIGDDRAKIIYWVIKTDITSINATRTFYKKCCNIVKEHGIFGLIDAGVISIFEPVSEYISSYKRWYSEITSGKS